MDENRIYTFITVKGKYFPSESITLIKETLEKMSPEQMIVVEAIDYKDPVIILLFSIFLGGLGIDRMLIGQVGLGIFKLLLTCFCVIGAIWVIVDWFLCMGNTRQYNLDRFMEATRGLVAATPREEESTPEA